MALAVIIFFLPFLPIQFFGRWNSIAKLNGQVISSIQLQPSLPDYKANLTGKDFIILNKKQIDTIVQLLRKTNMYFPSHPMRVWETKMIITTATKDALELSIHQTTDDGTVIYTPTNNWRQDDIGSYLEKLTKYSEPVYGDSAKPQPRDVK